jgi:hypothetical protein
MSDEVRQSRRADQQVIKAYSTLHIMLPTYEVPTLIRVEVEYLDTNMLVFAPVHTYALLSVPKISMHPTALRK